MAREITGNAYESRGKWYARVSLGVEIAWRKGRTRRPNVLLLHCHGEADADARAEIMAELSRALVGAARTDASALSYVEPTLERLGEIAPDDRAALDKATATVKAIVAGKVKRAPTTIGGLTFRAFGEKWTTGKLHELYPDHVAIKGTADDDRALLERHVYPHVVDVPLASFTLAHAEKVMRELPGHLRPATRRHVAQAMSRVLSLAVYPANEIQANPLPRGFLPKIRRDVAFSYVRPSEDRTLLAHKETPLVLRLLFGVLAREGMRASEAAGLEWSDVDLELGAVNLDTNKTDDPRTWALDRGVVDALTRWRKINPLARYVFERLGPKGERLPVDVGRLAEELRAALDAAGVSRPELFERSSSRRPLRAHDLRATFVTLNLAAGKSEAWIADRTGHRSSAMINRYRRTARAAAELGLGTLAPLAEALPELAKRPQLAAQLAATPKAPKRREQKRSRKTVVGPPGFEPGTNGLKDGSEPAYPLGNAQKPEAGNIGAEAVRRGAANPPPDREGPLGLAAGLRARAAELVLAGRLGDARKVLDALEAVAPIAGVVDLAAERTRRGAS